MDQQSENGRAASALTRKSPLAIAKGKEKQHSLIGAADGVSVTLEKALYSVTSDFNRGIASLIRGIDGAKFDKEAGAWQIPIEQYDALSAALPAVRKEAATDTLAKTEVAERAASIVASMGDATPAIRDFHPNGVTLFGEIVSVNGRYAAQLTGVDKGLACVVLHRLNDLRDSVFNGDRVGITCDGKGRATVQHVKSAEQQFDEAIGQSHEGVKVVPIAGSYQVSFEFNPALSERIQRVDGSTFDRDTKSWSVPADKKEFLARAVRDMRAEYAADKADRQDAEQLARDKVDNANVRPAYTADGQSYAGRIVGRSGRYVVQHTGREYMVLHRAAALGGTPAVGADVKVTYDKGRARVNERSREQAKPLER